MSFRAQAFPGSLPVFLKLAGFLLLILLANLAADWVVTALDLEIRPSTEPMLHRAIMTAALVYAGLIAVPFVPGVEVGLALIAMLGSGIVFLVYLATLAGLTLGFLVGRLIPLSSLARILGDLGFRRAGDLVAAVSPMMGQERLAFLLSKAPNRWVPFLLRHRYLALALVINLPGNIVIGGGGGIAMMAGASRLYTLPLYLLTIALAVAPLPLAIALFGQGLLLR